MQTGCKKQVYRELQQFWKCKDTGVTINNNPQVKLKLEVKNSLGQKYITDCRVLVSRINPNAFLPGMEIPVKIDPKNEMNVIFDVSGKVRNAHPFADTQVNTVALTAELEQMQKENDAIKVPTNEQGELQGGLTSVMSLTSIIGPPLMTNLFSYFTASSAPIYFPGAPFFMGALLCVLSVGLAMRSLSNYNEKKH